eukprot:4925743-Ditylum_brightwellii.AAC.1
MAKVIRDSPESIAGVSVIRLLDGQGSKQSLPAAGHNINVGGTNLSWKMSVVAFCGLKHDG